MSEITFKPESLSIEEIFGNADAFYQMPEYQRPYSWDKERVEQLWADISEAYKNHQEDNEMDANYFLGSLVVVKDKNGAYDVVDGQQRITTLMILFCVLRDLNLSELESYMPTIADSISSSKKSKERLKLTTQLNNQALFETTVLKGIDFEYLRKTSIENLENNRFLQTAKYFDNLIKKSQDESNEFYIADFLEFIKYLFEKTTLIRIVCNDENFAIKLFSVLNDRGLDLTSADIIKAHLLQKLDETARTQFNEVWKRIETLCKQMGESLQGVFNLYLYYIAESNPKKNLHDELKDRLKNSDPQVVILEIENFAKFLSEINLDYQDKDISKLKYLPHSVYWKSILLTAKIKNYPYYKELKSILVKYYYQSWIADGTSNRIKQTSFNIIKLVKNNKPIDEIKKSILENLKEYPNYLLSLERNNIYSFKWHKALLLAIEYEQKDAYQFVEITKDLHTEHILPQEWQAEGLNWSQFFDKETAQLYLNSLGNLTLLSGNKNIRASNKDYLDKKSIYIGKGLDGKTSFEITQAIFETQPDKWDKDSIIARQKWLVEEIKKIFEIN